jgi:hypothetical protein
LKKVLEDQKWIQLSLYEPESVLNFDNLLILLNFAFVYLVKLNDLLNNEETKARRLKEVFSLISLIVKLMEEVGKTRIQRRKLPSVLDTHVNDYKRRNSTVISLLKVLSMQMYRDLNDCKIVMLMLETGCSFEECRVERSIGLKIILNLNQNFRVLIFVLKKTLPTKKWEALNS